MEDPVQWNSLDSPYIREQNRVKAMHYANDSSPVDRPIVGEAERNRHMEINYMAEAERIRKAEPTKPSLRSQVEKIIGKW